MKYLIELKLPRQSIKYFSIHDKENKPRPLVFNHSIDAINYASYCVATKCKFNKWPQISEAELVHKYYKEAPFKCHLPRFVKPFVKVVKMEDASLICLFAKTAIDMYVADSFEFDDDSSIYMKLAEYDYTHTNITWFKQHLEERMNSSYGYSPNKPIKP